MQIEKSDELDVVMDLHLQVGNYVGVIM